MAYEPIRGTFVIGLGHKARHGKDSAAKHLMQKYGAAKFSFGSGLYSVARCCFGMTAKNALLLQALGTEVGRACDSDRWIRNLYWQIRDDAPSIAVVPDCRFPNEFDFIKSLGGVCIKVVRFNEDGSPFVAADRPSNHPSEIALDGCEDWDLQIGAKTGDLQMLHAKLDVFMRDMWILERYS